jgi:NhaP-type Na+/H+ or K+/H+ antiporter
LLVRPLAAWVTISGNTLPPLQRRMVAWFGIRGIGSLFYLSYALEHGAAGDTAQQLIAATLCCVAVSIVLHGVSATPLMAAYQRRRDTRRPRPPLR